MIHSKPTKKVSVEQTRELLQDQSLSNEDVEILRDSAYALAGVLIDHWLAQNACAEEGDSAFPQDMLES